MDKQKQIEEMAKIIRVNCGECNTCKYLDELHCADLLSAEELYNAGYRKIPENAVVLTREEYEKLGFVKKVFGSDDQVTASKIVKMMYIADKRARKETAEKFARLSKQKIDEEISSIILSHPPTEYDEVESIRVAVLSKLTYPLKKLRDKVIDEICKEITEGKV